MRGASQVHHASVGGTHLVREEDDLVQGQCAMPLHDNSQWGQKIVNATDLRTSRGNRDLVAAKFCRVLNRNDINQFTLGHQTQGLRCSP